VDDIIAYALARGYEMIRTDIAEMRRRFNFNPLEGASTMAFYWPPSGKLYINAEAHAFEGDAAGRRLAMGRSYVRRDLAGVADHEIGHLEHHKLIGDRITGPEMQDREWIDRSTDAGRRELLKMVDATSAYAATMPVEFVAEVYSGMVAGRTFEPWVMDLYRSFGGPTP
jgi:hypothetical protein